MSLHLVPFELWLEKKNPEAICSWNFSKEQNKIQETGKES